MATTCYILISGFDGASAQLVGLEKRMREAGYEGDFEPFLPYEYRPYPSPKEVADELARAMEGLLYSYDEVWIIGLSMGGQTAIKAFSLLTRKGLGSRIGKIIAIDPPWDDSSVTPPIKGHAVRAFGKLPPTAYRQWKLAAQSASIATMIHGSDLLNLDLMRVHVISCDDNREIIDSNHALGNWYAHCPPNSINVHTIAARHKLLDPTESDDSAHVWEWATTQATLVSVFEDIRQLYRGG